MKVYVVLRTNTTTYEKSIDSIWALKEDAEFYANHCYFYEDATVEEWEVQGDVQ